MKANGVRISDEAGSALKHILSMEQWDKGMKPYIAQTLRGLRDTLEREDTSERKADFIRGEIKAYRKVAELRTRVK